MDIQDELVFKQLQRNFKAFFNEPTNKQILLSGPFGSGKTTFLKTFFRSEKNANVFFLYPVNYALHSNSDIFEILKYDIILELIEKDAFEEIDISNLTKFIFSTAQTIEMGIGKIFSLFASTGKPMVEMVDILESAISKQEDFSQLANPMLSIQSFIEVIKKVKKYIHDDYISAVIKEKLQYLVNRDGKTNVLVVDDMDRIDPEHLFRIISVFSSHIDSDNQHNKFGFDKIIFVGDNENFRAIFSHRYGIRNNYDAYISKLSSKKAFNFDPDRELYAKVNHLLERIRFTELDDDESVSIYEQNSANIFRYYNYVISALIKAGVLSLRELNKSRGQHHKPFLSREAFIEPDWANSSPRFYPLYILLDTLFHDNKSVINAFGDAIESPLPADRILPKGGIDNKQLTAEMSTVPLQLLMTGITIQQSQRIKTIEQSWGENKYFLDVELGESQNQKSVSLTSSIANESNLLRLTLEAFLVMQKHVSKNLIR